MKDLLLVFGYNAIVQGSVLCPRTSQDSLGADFMGRLSSLIFFFARSNIALITLRKRLHLVARITTKVSLSI